MGERKYTLKEIDVVCKPLAEIVSRPSITCPQDAVSVFREGWGDMKIV